MASCAIGDGQPVKRVEGSLPMLTNFNCFLLHILILYCVRKDAAEHDGGYCYHINGLNLGLKFRLVYLFFRHVYDC
jgi:hypothetical protein